MRIPRGRAVGHLRGDAEQKAADQEGAAVHVGLLGEFARGDATRHAPRAAHHAFPGPPPVRRAVRRHRPAHRGVVLPGRPDGSRPGHQAAARTGGVGLRVAMEPCSSRETASRGLRLRHR